MRRVIGLTLAGLGTFLIVLALLVRTYVAGQLIKFPLYEHLTTTLQGTGVTYFSPSLVRQVSGATIRVTSTVKGDGAAGTSSTAVWNGFTYLYDVTNSAQVESATRRMAFDRRTAKLVNCCGASVGGDKSIRQSGLVGFLWPFGTQKTTYQVFDVTLLRPMPARFAGTSTIDGIGVYRFVERVQHARAGSQHLPGALVGLPRQSLVTLPEYYTATITYWVDPLTGAQLDVSQDQKVTIEDNAGAQRLLLFNGDLRVTPQSVRTTVGLDRSGRSEYAWFETIIPLVGGLVGLALLVVGIVLSRKRRDDDQPDHSGAAAPEPALDPEPAP